jgi:hypothetical protein
VGVWSDFATGDSGGNLLELYIQARQVDCGQALKECAEWLGEPLLETRGTQPVPRNRPRTGDPPKILPGEIYSPTDKECQQVYQMVARLRDDPALRDDISKKRGWKPETLRQLALELYLGWDDEKDAIAFIYDTGLKLRWREKGERIIRWAFGKPWLWRGAYLNFAQTVYVTEGETDAVALLDGGVEQQHATIVVALPSASIFNSEWAELFKGKNVILVFDADSAGQSATAKVSKILLPVVRSLKQLKWEGLQHAC